MSTKPSTLARLQELLPELFESKQLPGKSYLRCQLTPEVTVLLSMEDVQESLLTPGEEITPIPSMSPYVMGLMSSRDRVFCTIDLAQLLGLSSSLIQSQRAYHLVVVQVSQFVSQGLNSEQQLLLGLVFNRVQGITRVSSDQMKSPGGDFPQNLLSYVHGCLIEKEQQLPVLNLEAIVKKTLSA